MTYMYGEFSDNQIARVKENIRKSIFFLLLIVDNKTKNEYVDVDVNMAFENLLMKLGGLNKILQEPPELVSVMSLLKAAHIEFNSPEFSWRKYRKLILDAGSEVIKIKEVE